MAPFSNGPRLSASLFVSVVLLVSSGMVASTTVQAQDASGGKVLDRVVERYEDAETVLVSGTVNASNGSEPTVATLSYATADPDSSRLVVERANETYQTGSNGSVGWTVGPQGTAIWDAGSFGDRPPSGLPGNSEALDWAVPTNVNPENVSAEIVRTTQVNGTDATVLKLVPTTGETRVIRLWVASDDYRVLRAVTETDAARTVITIDEVRFDVAIHESTFQPPADRVSARTFTRYETGSALRGNTSLDVPQLDGGTFLDATVTDQQNGTIVAQRYDFDGENVTVVSTTARNLFASVTENASTVEIDGKQASVGTIGERSVVIWSIDDVTTVVVFRGPTDHAVDVAGHVSFP